MCFQNLLQPERKCKQQPTTLVFSELNICMPKFLVNIALSIYLDLSNEHCRHSGQPLVYVHECNYVYFTISEKRFMSNNI